MITDRSFLLSCTLLAWLLSAPLSVQMLAQENEATPADAAAATAPSTQLPEPGTVAPANTSDWKYYAELNVPPLDPSTATDLSQPLVEVIVQPELFSVASFDLEDLRVFDDSDRAYPHALRVLSPKSVRETVSATEFNRSDVKGEPQELTLELSSDGFQHNEVQVQTTGDAFRRLCRVEGSDNGNVWRPLATEHLLKTKVDDKEVVVDSLTYSESRYRFVRVIVEPDPEVLPVGTATDEFRIESAKVLRTVELPGQQSTWPAKLSEREPTRVYAAPGSAWTIDVGAENVPCDTLEVEVEDREFVRDVQLQVEVPSEYFGRPIFQTIYLSDQTTWQRAPGDPLTPMTLRFPETRIGRLRLVIADYQNVPLSIKSAKVSGAARQLLVPRNTPQAMQLRLFAGNPAAEPARYDFDRNLPERLATTPTQVEPGPLVENPRYVPPPVPFSERFSGLIYAVLAAACLLLLVLIAQLANQATRLHDATAQEPTAEQRPV